MTQRWGRLPRQMPPGALTVLRDAQSMMTPAPAEAL